MKKHRIGGLLAGALLVPTLLAACGSDSDSTSDATVGDASADTTLAVESSSADTTPSSSGPVDTGSEVSSDAQLEELIAAAQAEGELVWYSTLAEGDIIAAAFTEKYGIDVEHVRAVASDLVSRAQEEWNAGVNAVDVFSAAVPGFLPQPDGGSNFVEFDEDEIPELAAYDESSDFGDAVAMVTQEMTVGYNTAAVSEPPQTWDDLIRPEFNGEIVWINPDTSPTMLSVFAALYYDPEYGPEFVRQLGDASEFYQGSTSVGVEMVIAGEKLLQGPGTVAYRNQYQDTGAPFDILLGKLSPTGAVVVPVSVASTAPHPNAARLFMRWILSKEGQEFVAQEEVSGSVSRRDDMPAPPDAPTLPTLADAEKAAEEKELILDALGPNFNL